MNATRLQADFAACLLDPARPAPAGLRAWNGSDVSARLAVHRNNVVSSLIDALADTFPVVQAMVGAEFFRAMASVFVRRSPPRSPILARYGDSFPDFVAHFAPAQAVPPLADLARLEAARVRAHHAADAEPVDAGTVARAMAAGDRIGELRLQLHPSVSLIESPHAVVSLWAAHQGEGEGVVPAVDRAEGGLILRAGLEVVVLALPRGACAFIDAVQGGRPLGEAASRALASDAAFDLSWTLSLLLSHGALVSLQLPQEPPP